nr:YqhV family protein [Calidifontibacillus oryziterrae]
MGGSILKRWLGMVDTTVMSMAGLRILSGLIELSAAITMLLLNDVKKAIAVNALLAIVGPIILITTMTIGLVSLADQLSYSKLIYIGLGVGLILYGIYK